MHPRPYLRQPIEMTLSYVSVIPGRHTKEMSHLSNQALAAKHNIDDARHWPTSAVRRHAKVQSCMQDVLTNLP